MNKEITPEDIKEYKIQLNTTDSDVNIVVVQTSLIDEQV